MESLAIKRANVVPTGITVLARDNIPFGNINI